jgi:hypothetical protein
MNERTSTEASGSREQEEEKISVAGNKKKHCECGIKQASVYIYTLAAMPLKKNDERREKREKGKKRQQP